uniref:Uncharacterized protein n=1 Tax=Lygus hesperus TaxID=30085 RepID=A0A0A9YAH7_LYGHE
MYELLACKTSAECEQVVADISKQRPSHIRVVSAKQVVLTVPTCTAQLAVQLLLTEFTNASTGTDAIKFYVGDCNTGCRAVVGLYREDLQRTAVHSSVAELSQNCITIDTKPKRWLLQCWNQLEFLCTTDCSAITILVPCSAVHDAVVVLTSTVLHRMRVCVSAQQFTKFAIRQQLLEITNKIGLDMCYIPRTLTKQVNRIFCKDSSKDISTWNCDEEGGRQEHRKHFEEPEKQESS